ncbi:ATP-binding protein [Streptomyces sp. NPDC056257]|uniref:ATP-binding protein n=1 Tax=Streptomyces sp. NPDC056257 TaxID=3345765 RepID=UPI0035DA850F
MSEEPSDVSKPYPAVFIELIATAEAAGYGRQLVTEACAFWGLDGDVVDRARLIMSEIVTNAFIASSYLDASEEPGGLLMIAPQLRIDGSSLFVEVLDKSPRMPRPRTVDDAPSLDAEGGRGLILVESLSDRWGVSAADEGSKIVWARLDLKQAPPVSFAGCAVPLSEDLMHATITGTDGPHTTAANALMVRMMHPLTLL